MLLACVDSHHIDLSRVTRYHVRVLCTSGESWTVERRFSEFVVLGHCLSRPLKGVDKHPFLRLTSNLDDEVIAQRQRALDQFVREVCTALLQLSDPQAAAALQFFDATDRGEEAQARATYGSMQTRPRPLASALARLRD